MSITTTRPADMRQDRAVLLLSVARAALFAVAIGVFLAAPPALPWVLLAVATTNVAALVVRAHLVRSASPLGLLLLNGITVALVVIFSATAG